MGVLLSSEWSFGSIVWLIIIILFVLYKLGVFEKPVEGDFYCPKCHKKCGVERNGLDMVGTMTPYRRFKCTNCGFTW